MKPPNKVYLKSHMTLFTLWTPVHSFFAFNQFHPSAQRLSNRSLPLLQSLRCDAPMRVEAGNRKLLSCRKEPRGLRSSCALQRCIVVNCFNSLSLWFFCFVRLISNTSPLHFWLMQWTEGPRPLQWTCKCLECFDPMSLDRKRAILRVLYLISEKKPS